MKTFNQKLAEEDKKPTTVFFTGGRDATLFLGRPFFKRDAEAIKKYIEALHTDDEELIPKQSEDLVPKQPDQP